MTTFVKIHRKGQMTLPSRLRSAIGVSEGDVVEAKLWRGKIVITPQSAIDRSQFPNADDEYTTEQRRAIDARLNKAEESIKAGRVQGPFTARQAKEYIERLAKERKAGSKAAKPKRSPQ